MGSFPKGLLTAVLTIVLIIVIMMEILGHHLHTDCHSECKKQSVDYASVDAQKTNRNPVLEIPLGWHEKQIILFCYH